MDISVRKFRKKDVFKVCNLIKRAQRITLRKYYPKKLIEAFCRVNRPKSFLERLKKRAYFVAEEKNTKKILGIAGLEKNEVKTFYVDPRFQKKGVGRLL